jgi:chromosome segregation ATPase
MAIKIYATVFSLLLSLSAWADTQTYIREYTYIASEADSKISSRKIAKQEVKRELLAELGTHIFSKFEMSESAEGDVEAKEEIVALTAGFVAIETLEEKWNGTEYYIKAKLEADPEEIHKQLESFQQDDEKSQELKSELLASHEESERLRARLQVLQSELNSTDNEEDQARIQQEYDEEVEQLNMLGLTARALGNQVQNGFGWLKGTLDEGHTFGRSFLQSLGDSDD